MMYFASAIHQLYPTVVRTVGEDAFDADGNPVIYDRTLVEVESSLRPTYGIFAVRIKQSLQRE